jgi:hypothetical protein
MAGRDAERYPGRGPAPGLAPGRPPAVQRCSHAQAALMAVPLSCPATAGHGGAARYRHGAHCPPAARAAHAGPYQHNCTGQHHHSGQRNPAIPPNMTTAT